MSPMCHEYNTPLVPTMLPLFIADSLSHPGVISYVLATLQKKDVASLMLVSMSL